MQGITSKTLADTLTPQVEAAALVTRRPTLARWVAIAAGVVLPVALVSNGVLIYQANSLRAPNPNTRIVLLSSVRSAASVEPTVQLTLPTEPGWVVFAMELPKPHYPLYRAALRDSKGRSLWSGSNLEPDFRNELTLSLLRSMLPPDD